jgi:hypothetical protein
MTTDTFDVAISFLHRDEPLALQLQSKLIANLSVFVYSKEQENLAGTDGMESFRLAFRSQSRLSVVLYRKGWGETPWTRVEATAIQEKCLENGWDSLLFVMLETGDTPPIWLPEMNIRLDFSMYGEVELIGAIKTRAEKIGSKLRTEDSLTRAKRTEAATTARIQRDLILVQNGVAAAQQERDILIETLGKRVSALTQQVPTLGTRIGYGGDHVCTLVTSMASINFYLHLGTPADKSRIVLREWDVVFSVPPARQGIFLKDPQELSVREFYFDYQASRGGWCWHNENRDKLLTTGELSEHILKMLMELHDRVHTEAMNPDREQWWETGNDS